MTTHDGNLPGPNPYTVKTISVGVTRDVRIGHEGDEGNSVWLSAQQFLSLLDGGGREPTANRANDTGARGDRQSAPRNTREAQQRRKTITRPL